jgi:thymidylate kinase
MIITINGPDGSGKGTILDLLIEKVGKPVKHIHSRPGNLLKKPETISKFVEEPGSVPAKPKLAQFAKLGLFLAEFHSFGLLQKLSAGGTLVILERSLADLTVHPQRYGLSGSVSRLASVLASEWYADLNILLSGDAAQIAQRKEELQASEIQALSDRYLAQLGKAKEKLLVLDTTSGGPAAMVDAILARILTT